MIKLKRVYDEPERDDGTRVLVDRVWPRGVRKGEAALDRWMKDVAPSTQLRKWFSHDPEKWNEFYRRYAEELEHKPDQVDRLRRLQSDGNLTLVFAAKDREHNNAAALKKYLETH